MKKTMMNRILGLLLVLSILTGLIPASVLAEDTDPIVSVGNSAVALYVNKANGGFTIKTLGGTKARKSDANKNLLFSSDDYDTSFTSIRVDGEDYIYGREYGFWGLQSGFVKPATVEENVISSIWRIKDVEVEQRLTMIQNDADDFYGNVIIEYIVHNTGGNSVSVATRVMLDTMLGESDGAPFEIAMTKDRDPAKTGERYEHEASFSGDNVPIMWKAYDSFRTPLIASYGFTGDYVAQDAAPPDTFVMAHWNNLAGTVFDYTPDPDVYFSNVDNTYDTADGAVALYWNTKDVTAGQSVSYKTNYGVMVNTVVGEADFGINIMTEKKLQLTPDQTAYENGGRFNVTVEIDNSIVPRNEVKDIEVVLMPEAGLSLEGQNRTLTVSVPEVETGKSIKLDWPMLATVQEISTVKELRVDVIKDGKTLTSSRTFILLPGRYNKKPEITITKTTPDKVYAYDEKYITVAGTGFDNLVNTQLWDMYLVDMNGSRILVPASGIAVDPDSGVITAAVPTNYIDPDTGEEKAFIPGPYQVSLEIDEQLVQTKAEKSSLTTVQANADSNLQLFSDKEKKELNGPDDVNMTEDPNDANRRSSVLAVLREWHTKDDDYNVYTIKTYPTLQAFEEEKKKLYQEEQDFDPDDTDDDMGDQHGFQLMMYIQGDIVRTAKDAKDNKQYYTVNASARPVIINDCLSYQSAKPMIVQQVGGETLVTMDGPLKNIGAAEVSRYESMFRIRNGVEYTLTMDKFEEDARLQRIKLEFGNPATGPIAKGLMTLVAGMGLELTMGELRRRYEKVEGEEEKEKILILDGIAYGGSLDLNFLSLGGKKKDTTTDKKDGKQDSSKTSSAGGDAAAANDSSTANDQGVKGEVRNVLYGRRASGKYGFVGLEASVGFQLPNVLGSITKEHFTGGYFNINTYERSAQVETTIGLKPYLKNGKIYLNIKCMLNEDEKAPIPDELVFWAEWGEPGVPLGTTPASLTALGGGFSNLYESIYGSGGVPPITVMVRVGMDIAKILEGTAALEVSGQRILAQIPNLNIKKMGDKAGFYDISLLVQWDPTVRVKLEGNINILDIILAYLLVGGGEDYFEFIARGAICIPPDVPGIGGKTVIGAELGADLSKFWGMLTLCGLDFSVQYYWGEEVTADYPGPVPASLSAFGASAAAEPSGFIFGGNVTLSSSSQNAPEAPKAQAMGMMTLASGSTVTSVSDSRVTSSEYVLNMGADLPSAMIEVMAYTGDPAIYVTKPDGSAYKLVEADVDSNGVILNNEKANFWYQTIDGVQKAYISIPPSVMAEGKWMIGANQHIEMNVHGVTPIPKLTQANMLYEPETQDIQVNWPPVPNGTVSVYLTKDKFTADDTVDFTDKNKAVSASGDLGTLLKKEVDSADGSVTVKIPETMESGDYYVHTILKLDGDGISSVYASAADGADTISFTNPNAPAAPKRIEVTPVGDGYFMIIPEAEGAVDGYSVEVYEEDGLTPVSTFATQRFASAEPILVGGYERAAQKGTYENPEGSYTSEKDKYFEIPEDVYTGLESGRKYVVKVRAYNELMRPDESGTEVAVPVMSAAVASAATLLPVPTPPELAITCPEVMTQDCTISFTANRPVTADVYIDGDYFWAFTEPGTQFSVQPDVGDGPHRIEVKAFDADGDTASQTAGFERDNLPPELVINAPISGDYFDGGVIDVKGYIEPECEVEFYLDGQKMEGADTRGTGDMAFQIPIDSASEKHELIVRATDAGGNVSEHEAKIYNHDAAQITGIYIDGDGVENGVLKVLPGETKQLRVMAKCAGGLVYELDPSDIVWDNMNFPNVDLAQDGTATFGESAGVSYAKASLFVADGFSYDGILIVEAGMGPVMQTNVTYEVKKGAPVSVDLNTLFTDPNGLPLTYQADGGAIDGSRWTFNAERIGTYVVNVKATNTLMITGAGTITVIVTDPGGNDSNGSTNNGYGNGTVVVSKEYVYEVKNGEQLVAGAAAAGDTSIHVNAYKYGAQSTSIVIPVKVIAAAKEAGIRTIEIKTAKGTLNYDTGSIIFSDSDQSLRITLAQVDPSQLTVKQKEDAGSNPTYRLAVSCEGGGSTRLVTAFEKPVELLLPYSLAAGQFPFTVVLFAHGETPANLGGNLASGTLRSQISEPGDFFAKDNYTVFEDVRQGDWFFEYVTGMAAKGYLKGTGGNLFEPDRPVTRAEFAAILARMLRLDTKKDFIAPFTDTQPNAWYFNEVMALYELGIVKGISETLFAPDAVIARQDMVVMLMRVLAYLDLSAPEDADTQAFSDADAISDYAKQAVGAAAELGIISGKGNGIFDPLGNATRAETAKVLTGLNR